MIYELRVYKAVPGQMPKLLARFRDKLLPIWERHGIRPIGFWTTLLGESSNELTYILPWESLADRETRWTAFQNDPAWHNVRDDSERDGPIVASISNQISNSGRHPHGRSLRQELEDSPAGHQPGPGLRQPADPGHCGHVGGSAPCHVAINPTKPTCLSDTA